MLIEKQRTGLQVAFLRGPTRLVYNETVFAVIYLLIPGEREI